MEHRYSPRIRDAVYLGLHHHDRWLGTHPTRDLSADGLFLETGPILLRPNDPVVLRIEAVGPHHGLSAFVVHSSPQGIGLMLTEEDPHYARILLEVLRRGGSNPPWARYLARLAAQAA